MRPMNILMDLVFVDPVEPQVDVEIVEKTILPMELSTALLAARIGHLAVCLINFIIKKGKK